ncbi:MAG: hypothetical protein HYY16_08140 [Planctomycetes bacterium]|nr:hypothetical protein [Planctomycetota bacterium]
MSFATDAVKNATISRLHNDRKRGTELRHKSRSPKASASSTGDHGKSPPKVAATGT